MVRCGAVARRAQHLKGDQYLHTTIHSPPSTCFCESDSIRREYCQTRRSLPEDAQCRREVALGLNRSNAKCSPM
eukprot:4799040-Alexandrium_andersonii.AAC.1